MHNILYLVKSLCSKNSITIAELERNLNFSPASISKWDKSKPSIDKIKAVANYFNVSTDYLLNRTNVSTPIDQVFSDPELLIIQRLRTSLSQRDKEKMMNVLRAQFAEDFPEEENINDDL